MEKSKWTPDFREYFKKRYLQEFVGDICCGQSSWLSNDIITKEIQQKMFLIEVIL